MEDAVAGRLKPRSGGGDIEVLRRTGRRIRAVGQRRIRADMTARTARDFGGA